MTPIEIETIVDVRPGQVLLEFPTPVDGLGMSPAMARQLAFDLWESARLAEVAARDMAAEQVEALVADLERQGR